MTLPYNWQSRLTRWKNTLRSLAGFGEPQPSPPRLCPACGKLVGTTATRCHECGTSMRFSLTALGKSMGGIFGGPAPVTTFILILNILLFAITWLATMKAGGGGGLFAGMNGQVLFKLGGSYGPAIFQGLEFNRLVTAIFLHGGLLHIGSNMMVLMDVGPQVEEVYGSPRYFFLYLATGVAGFLLSAVRGHFSVGASGALMGLIGLMLAITTRRGGAYMRELRGRLLSWVGMIFLFGFLMPIVDNWGHFGGLAAGFGLGKLFADRQPLNGKEQNRAYALGWLAGLVLLASFAAIILGQFHFPAE